MSNKKAKSSEVPIKKKVAREAAEWGKSLLYAVVAATIIRLFVFETMLVPTGSMIPTINPKDRLFIEKITYTAREPKIGDIVVFWSPYVDERAQTMLRWFDKFMDLFAPRRFKGHVKYVKRLVGREGDVLQIKKDEQGQYRLYVNGEIPESLKNIVYEPEGIFEYPELINWFVEASRLRKDLIAYQRYLQDLASKQGAYAANLVASVVGGIPQVPLGIPFYEAYDKIYADINISEYIRNAPDGVTVTVPEGFYFFMGDNSKESFDSRYFGFVPKDHVIGRPILRIWPFQSFGPVQGS